MRFCGKELSEITLFKVVIRYSAITFADIHMKRMEISQRKVHFQKNSGW